MSVSAVVWRPPVVRATLPLVATALLIACAMSGDASLSIGGKTVGAFANGVHRLVDWVFRP